MTDLLFYLNDFGKYLVSEIGASEVDEEVIKNIVASYLIEDGQKRISQTIDTLLQVCSLE